MDDLGVPSFSETSICIPSLISASFSCVILDVSEYQLESLRQKSLKKWPWDPPSMTGILMNWVYKQTPEWGSWPSPYHRDQSKLFDPIAHLRIQKYSAEYGKLISWWFLLTDPFLDPQFFLTKFCLLAAAPLLRSYQWIGNWLTTMTRGESSLISTLFYLSNSLSTKTFITSSKIRNSQHLVIGGQSSKPLWASTILVGFIGILILIMAYGNHHIARSYDLLQRKGFGSCSGVDGTW